uniref:Protein kinase domain-containing protein n=1 Tax=Ascaris lumbricoides TaxID=6252 RepID=A0A0M3I863_ASCLU
MADDMMVWETIVKDPLHDFSGTAPGRGRSRAANRSSSHGQFKETDGTAANNYNTLVQKIFGPMKTFERWDEPKASSAEAERQGERSPDKNDKNAGKGQGKDDDQWSVNCEDFNYELTVEDSDGRQNKKVKPLILKEGENLEISGKKFKLCSAMTGNYGFAEIIEEESKMPFYLHYETMVNSKKRKLKVGCQVHILAAAANRTHIIRLIQRGTDTSLHVRYFVTDAYGPTLSDLQSKRAYQKFTVGTATRLSIESLNAIEDLHAIGYVHRDIRPTSFIIGRGAFESQIYLINFGCVRKFRTKDGKIIPARSYAPFVSSVRYASRACHDRLECARKDDLESWLFMSVEFYHINILSWRSMSNLAEIRREKEAFMSERGARALRMDCLSLPPRLPSAVTEISSLRYETTPNYEALREIFKKHLETKSFKIRSKWDWISTTTAESMDNAARQATNLDPPKNN